MKSAQFTRNIVQIGDDLIAGHGDVHGQVCRQRTVAATGQQLCAAPDAAVAVQRHRDETDSAVAADLLGDWDSELANFCKVMPNDYKRVLDATRLAEAEGRDVIEAVMEASRG